MPTYFNWFQSLQFHFHIFSILLREVGIFEDHYLIWENLSDEANSVLTTISEMSASTCRGLSCFGWKKKCARKWRKPIWKITNAQEIDRQKRKIAQAKRETERERNVHFQTEKCWGKKILVSENCFIHKKEWIDDAYL